MRTYTGKGKQNAHIRGRDNRTYVSACVCRSENVGGTTRAILAQEKVEVACTSLCVYVYVCVCVCGITRAILAQEKVEVACTSLCVYVYVCVCVCVV